MKRAITEDSVWTNSRGTNIVFRMDPKSDQILLGRLDLSMTDWNSLPDASGEVWRRERDSNPR